MPIQLDEPTYKTILHIYYADAVEMERIYGRGWTGIIRELVRQHLKERKAKWEAQSTS
jgi:hypothetical protein